MLETKSYPGTRHLVLLDAGLLKKCEQNVFYQRFQRSSASHFKTVWWLESYLTLPFT